MLRRRDVLAVAPAAALLGAPSAWSAPFSGGSVRAIARDLARRPYQPRPADLPPALAAIDYDAYRDLRFSPEQAIWRGADLPFQLQLFHRGGMFRDRVDLFEVVSGVAQPIGYRPEMFTYGRVRPGPLGPELGFAGFRVHAPIKTSGRFDEVAAFLGASYFRAVSKATFYGLSARGLALGAGEPNEEFPLFRAFWIVRPARSAVGLVVHALLDSPSVAGAYRFIITPGEPTTFDVTASLYPRRALARAGLAPLTSMFLFDPNAAGRFDDFRPRVHDSEGLLIDNGRSERLWRPLGNPRVAQSSAFLDTAPRGFGLMQRERAFAAYQDLEARYDRRPGLWVEPLSGFGSGDVRLVELPTPDETEDNIVACWRPSRPLAPGVEHRFAYRLRWGSDPAPARTLAQVAHWRAGRSARSGRRRYIVDFTPAVAGAVRIDADVSASSGAIGDLVVHPNDATGGLRVSFEFTPAEAPASDLRASLSAAGKSVSEVWIHRWLA